MGAKEVWLSLWNELRGILGDQLLSWAHSAYPRGSHAKNRLASFIHDAMTADIAEAAKDPKLAKVIRDELSKNR